MTLSLFIDWTPWNYLSAAIDVAILAYVIYKAIMLVRGTRAVQLIRGILILLVVAVGSDVLGLHAVSWILNQFWSVIFIALAVIFQPELRRMLEKLGRGKIFTHGSVLIGGELAYVIDEVVAASVACAKTKTGALVVLERNTGLSDYIETGVEVDAKVSQELLNNIFVKDTPMHDGATIISGDRVAAAACFLPLSDNPYISLSLGTRHRAGIGISEVSDALAVIVSEETGAISVAQEGKLIRHLDEKQLRELLSTELARSAETTTAKGKGGATNVNQ